MLAVMARVVALGLVVTMLFCPRAARADPIRFHPSVAVGLALGTAKEKVECSKQGAFACPLPAKTEHGFGFEAAPTFEALVMAGRSIGFRFGLGVRYLPGMLLDTGNELHLAIVPEVIGELPGKRIGFGRLFNAVGFAFPKPDIGRRQEPTRNACASLDGVEGAHCSDWSNRNFISFGLELGLFDRFEGYALRYGLGFQGLLMLNHAVAHGYSGNDPDDSDDSLYVTYENEAARFVAHVGVEF